MADLQNSLEIYCIVKQIFISMLGIRTKNKIYCSYIEKLLSKFGSIQKIQLICNTIYNNRKMNTLVELSIKDFKAIKRADVQLDGITVVSGVNGCGKSTMSKLLYYIFRNANSFEELVLLYTNSQIRPYLNVLEQIQSLLLYRRDTSSYRRLYFRNIELTSLESTHSFLDLVKDLCARFLNLESDLQKAGNSIITERLRLILRSTLKSGEDRDTKKMLDALVRRISEHLTKAEQLNVERPYRLLKESLNAAFDVNLSKSIVLKEYGDAILGENLSNVPLLHYIKKVAYIDTPMVIGMETSSQQPIYWKELNLLLKQPPRRGYKRTINNIIKEDIIKGDVSFDEDGFSAGFKYKREDGKEFDLLECATGIKSFSLLQLLLKNLFLDESTLLIIDEPEAHLHPQWIVEYARLIVLLHKKVGVKFFIASHSTDMVSAIRYIAEEEKCLSSLSFYVAENEEQKSNAFVFRPLGHDIEPIFESFNKSFERLDYYVSKKKK